MRTAAAAAYSELPWPSSGRDEDWRRTPQIDKLNPSDFQPYGDSSDLAGFPTDAAEDGYWRSAGLAITGMGRTQVLRESAGLRSIDVGFAEDPSWGALLSRLAAPGLRKLVALNTALFRSGATIRVQGRSSVRLVHGVAPGGAEFPRILVDVEAGSELTLVEELRSSDEGASLLVPVAEIRLGSGAHVTHLILQRCGAGTVVHSTVRTSVAEGARYDARWAFLGARWQKSYLEVLLEGQGSEAQLNGLYLGRAQRHIDLQTLQDHIAPNAVSDLLYRTAVGEKSRSVFAGLIRVEERAQKTNAYVQNRNLLLSPTAKADSNPTLEILANDVRCTHGSAAGRLDEEQLFYSQARGIPRDDARRMVVEGFFADVLDSFPDDDLREVVRGWVVGELEQLAATGALRDR